MIEKLLPSEAVAVEAFDDEADAPLYPEERAAISHAVDTRRQEFATVRRCAHAALKLLGVPRSPIPPGERGAPRWPSGVVGSMTHCAGYRAAVVARSNDIASIGIDAEPNGPLPDGTLEVIARPDERADLDRLAGGDVCWDRLLFCAKESVYKTWFPLAKRWVGFDDATVALDPAGTFHAYLHVSGPLDTVTGRWLATDDLIITAIATPRG